MNLHSFPVAAVLDTSTIRDIRPEALDPDGRIRVLPAAYWKTTTVQERGLFGWHTGTYSFPTTELVELIRKIIGGRTAIEIGAGHGVLAQALGITATDSKQHERSPWKELYVPEKVGRGCPYGPNVIELDAAAAVKKFQPDVIIGSWVTWKYEQSRNDAKGNAEGVDELDLLANCQTYIMIGNQKVHALSRLWSRPHTVEYPDFVFSRAVNGSPDFVAIVKGSRRKKKSR